MENIIYRIGKTIMNRIGDLRKDEYKVAIRYFNECQTILDVGCGTGTFLEIDPNRIIGIDINPDNVSYCCKKGLQAQVGNALNIPFEDNSFDGVYCSHVMQVFSPNEAAQLIRELSRVARPDGIVVLVTLNWFKRFYRHPENTRAYPPDAIWRYFSIQKGASSPMYPNMPKMLQEDIWLRRPPLIEFYSATNPNLARIASVLNAVQYGLFLRKFWAFDAYIIKLRKR
jgi:ubiquinone/menaquinone biosynthesis C-methylase UbiE